MKIAITIILLIIFAIQKCIQQLRISNVTPNQIKSKYGKKVIVITGATGSLGQQLIKQLYSHYYIIAIGRDQEKLNMLKQKYATINIALDFSINLDQFQNQFELELKNNNINQDDIQIVFLNHGSGLMQKFDTISMENVQGYINSNLTSHIVLMNYFSQISGCKIFLTGSCIAYSSNKNYELYHISKNALLKMAQLLNCYIINPPTIRDSGFFDKMPSRTGLRKLGSLRLLSVDTERLYYIMMYQLLYDVKVYNVGIVTWFSKIAGKFK